MLLAWTLPAMTCVGCVANSNDVESEEQGVHQTLVYTVQVNESHKIDFYEYGLGMTGVHETFPAGEVEALRLPDDQPRTLAQLFDLVRPGDRVPNEIQRADARALVAREDLEAKLASDPHFLPAALRSDAVDPGRELGQVSQPAITCSGDFFGDQWGASWFIQNFDRVFSFGVTCPSGPSNVASFSESNTITNFFSAQARHPTSRILQWKQMEGDFSNAGSTIGMMVKPGLIASNLVLWNHSIAPRNISIHTMNPNSLNLEWLAQGTSPCTHLHRTIIWCDRS
jgi:hypothetical protein